MEKITERVRDKTREELLQAGQSLSAPDLASGQFNDLQKVVSKSDVSQEVLGPATAKIQEKINSGAPILFEDVLVAHMQDIIGKWVNGSKNRTIAGLGRKSKVGEHNIRRIMNDDKLISPTLMLKVLQAISDTRSVQDLKKLCSTELQAYFSKELPYINFENKGGKESNEFTCEEMLSSDSKLYRIYFYIAVSNGVSREELRNEFGISYQDFLGKLVDKNIVFEKEEGKFYLKENVANLSVTKAQNKKAMGMLLEHHYRPNEGDNEAFIFGDRLTSDGYDLARKVVEECFQKLDAIASEHKGEIPFFTCVFTDILTLEEKQKYCAKKNSGSTEK